MRSGPTCSTERWCLVVPVKRLSLAKSRLSGIARVQRRELALAFALDTVGAALSSPVVEAVVVVTDEPDAGRSLTDLGALVIGDEPDAGLNPALRHGAEVATRRFPSCGVGALSADLPALRPDELTRALGRAPAVAACIVRDAQGAGTTALLARRSVDFAPAFGPGSAALHLADGAVELTGAGLESVRHDVDTLSDLERALSMGVGPRTAAAARRLTPAGSR